MPMPGPGYKIGDITILSILSSQGAMASVYKGIKHVLPYDMENVKHLEAYLIQESKLEHEFNLKNIELESLISDPKIKKLKRDHIKNLQEEINKLKIKRNRHINNIEDIMNLAYEKDIQIPKNSLKLILCKYLSEESIDEYAKDIKKKFLNEIRIQSSLYSHTNITQSYDSKKDRNGIWFFSEFIDGSSLESILKYKKMEPISASVISLKIARALEYIHSKKIVHRDINPSNVIVCNDGEVKIIDFGVAIEEDELSQKESMMEFVGTPPYISPEQAMIAKKIKEGAFNDNQIKMNRKIDIFSLGVVYYEMLTNKLPFVDVDSISYTNIIKAKPPSIKQHCQHQSLNYDPRTENICYLMLKKNPDARPEANDVAKMLTIYLRKQGIDSETAYKEVVAKILESDQFIEEELSDMFGG
jgi:serine/threonine protein kinase